MSKTKAPKPASAARPRGADYLKIVEWSEEDGCFIGSAPPLVGPSCHGQDATEVFREIFQIVEEHLKIREEDGLPVPAATLQKDHSGKFILRTGAALHKALAVRAAQTGDGLNAYCLRKLEAAVTQG